MTITLIIIMECHVVTHRTNEVFELFLRRFRSDLEVIMRKPSCLKNNAPTRIGVIEHIVAKMYFNSNVFRLLIFILGSQNESPQSSVG